MDSELGPYQLPGGSYTPPSWQASVYIFTRPFMVICAFNDFIGMAAVLRVPALAA